MKKTVIVYQTLLGSTKKYANWLHHETGAGMFTTKQIGGSALSDYDQIVVMSGTYAAQMPLIKFLVKNWSYIKNKKVVIVGVGAAPSDDEQSRKSYELIPEDIRSKIIYFKLPGRLFAINRKLIKIENLDPIIKELS